LKTRLSSFSILVVFFVFTVIGFALTPFLPFQFLPNSGHASFTIQFSYESSPHIIEQQVTTPLEGAFNLVHGINRIYSISENGTGNIQLELDENEDLDILRFEIASKIRQLYPQFPEGVSYPQLLANNPEKEIEDRPLLTYSLSGQDSPSELFKYANEILVPQLGITDGLRSVEVRGGNLMEWRITYFKDKMRILGVQLSDVQSIIQDLFQTKAIGISREENHSFFVILKNTNWNESIERFEWKQIPIIKKESKTIFLGDIATINLEEQLPQQYYRINGQNSVRLIFYAEQHTNHIELAKKIKSNIKQINTLVPPSYHLFLDDDPTKNLIKELNKIIFLSSLSLGILLLFVLVVYRSWKHLIIILSSLLANLGLAFIIYYFWQVEMHLYALAGITVSFGVVIDNSIVMVHHLRSQGNFKIFPALLAATLTTISALSVIWFLPELWKISLLNFAKVIIINLAVSLMIVYWLIPALLDKLLESPNKINVSKFVFSKKNKTILHINSFYEKLLRLIFRFRKLAIIFVVLLFGLPIFFLPNQIKGWEIYNQTLGNEFYIKNIKPSVNKWLGGTLRLFSYYVYEGANYRQPEESILYVVGSMPNGHTTAQMDAVYQQIEAYLSTFSSEIEQYTTHIASGQYASIKILFNENFESTFPHQLKSGMIQFCNNLGGVEWDIYGVGKEFSNNSSKDPPRFSVKFLGYNYDELSEQAQLFVNKLLKNPRIKKINTEANIEWWSKNLYQYELQWDKKLLVERKVNLRKLTNEIRTFDQNSIPDFYTPQRTAIRFIDHDLPKNDLWVLKNQPLPLDSTFILLSRLASLEKKKVVAAIHKENQQYIRMVEFEYNGSERFGQKYLNKCMEEMKKEMPLGYSMEESQLILRTEKAEQNWLVLIVIGFIFFICAIMFESLYQAFAVVLLIPTSFIGIFLTFYWFEFNFDQGGYASFILLSGIVVNSIIFLVNDYNQFRKRYINRSDLKNYLKAFQHKISPILLTITSTALGMIPFLIQGQNEVFWFSLAAGTIGGLVFSMVIILFFIPLFMVRRNKSQKLKK